ncbi:MAG: HypC/HybG/HupF family hydrogenase formation chaperone [Actinomycetota bacterium]|nr:HypC/HybG/HupF family hydrogenase formation chaperone [Actinomycetota bacterium]
MTFDSGCGSDHCITCSDEAVPMRVLEEAAAGVAVCVDGEGSRSEVMTDLVGSVAPGDAVLVHAGVALVRLDSEAAA